MTAQMDLNLHPPVALVTGATSGIGRATAVKLASDGFLVLVHGRDDARGAETVKLIEQDGHLARFVQADLTNPEDVTRLAEQARDPEVLVNNAGMSWFEPTVIDDVGWFYTDPYEPVAAIAGP
jgi:NAD(P)-dependent dehydrogenase (short-subunit alcohol dehydrogenase family)